MDFELVQQHFDVTNPQQSRIHEHGEEDSIDHRKSHLLEELGYYLNLCEITDTTTMTNMGSKNANNILGNQQCPTDEYNDMSHYSMQKIINDGNYSVYTLTKNYIALATEYKMWDRYRLHRNFTNPCVICLQNTSLLKVLFPCEHRCICESCFHQVKSWKECPLCKEEVRLSLVRPFIHNVK
jgi:hypothetical protein